MKKTLASIALVSLCSHSLAGPEPYVGEIMWTGANFCPEGWANADGRLLAIQQFPPLYSLYGNTYGGDGRVTFALPDLRGRVVMHAGDGPGLTPRSQGETGGSEVIASGGNQVADVKGKGSRGSVDVPGNGNMQPFSVLRACVALKGTYPPRN